MYAYKASLEAIDAHSTSVMIYLLTTVVFAFLYFIIAVRMTIKQKVYVVPFIGSALFFWHDLTFVLQHDLWFNVYNHWWVKMWWYALCGTVALEVLMIWYVYRFGQQELWPNISRGAYGTLIVLGTLGIGAMWYLIKVTLNDELFFVTFTITASFSVPFHTAILSRRQSRAGQSIIMELSTIVMLLCETAAFARLDPFFTSAPYLIFVAAFVIWPLVNVYLILQFPKLPEGV